MSDILSGKYLEYTGNAAGDEVIDGPISAVEVKSAASGDSWAFDKDEFKTVAAGEAFIGPWNRLRLKSATGALVVRVWRGRGGPLATSRAVATDSQNVTQVTGANQDGTAAGRVEAGVMVAGRDQSGEKRTLTVGNLDSGLFNGGLVFPLRDKTASATAILGAQSGPGGGGVGYPAYMQKHYASIATEKGFLYAKDLIAGVTAGAGALFWTLFSGSSLNLYLLWVRITTIGQQTAAGAHTLFLQRISSLTGGTDHSSNINPTHSQAATAFSGTCKINPTAYVAESTAGIRGRRVIIPAAETTLNPEIFWDFAEDPVRIPSGGAHGVLVAQGDALAAGQTGLGVEAAFFERSY